MSEIQNIEQEEAEQIILEGEYQSSTKQVRHFKTLTALLDYCRVFNIENAGYGKGYLQSDSGDHQLIFQLEYIRNDD